MIALLAGLGDMAYFDLESYDNELRTVLSLTQVTRLADALSVPAAALFLDDVAKSEHRVSYDELVALVASRVPQPVSTRAFVAACAIAGALAVPVNAVASPVSTLVAGLVGFLGLRLWNWSRLRGSLKTGANDRFERVVWSVTSLGLGLLVGLLLLGVIRLAIEPFVPAAGARIAAAASLPIWRRLVIVYVAAVGEELVFRLVLLSLVAGLTIRLLSLAARAPSRGIVWASIGLSAFAFAAVHLPAWRTVGPLSPGLALMVMILNSLGGVVFGYVFVTRGIVAAIWAHAGADCAIQFIGPLT